MIPTRTLLVLSLSAALAASAIGCDRSPEVRREPESKPAPSASPSSSPAPVPEVPTVLLTRGVRFVKVPQGDDVHTLLRTERDKARAANRDVIVYVGATWCEPCQRFHKAAQAGALDEAFPNLTLLEFDLDEDRERLVTAGYVSTLIPLFVKPGADGKPTSARFEGSVKGDGAVTNIAPRLKAILGG